MPFSARKMHFFEKNGNLTPCPAQPSADVKELFFREVILHQFLKRKNIALYSKIAQAIFPLYNFAQQVPFLEDLKKKVSKPDWNQRHIVYVTQIHYYSWFQTTFGPKNAIIEAKTDIFHFSKINIFSYFLGFLRSNANFMTSFKVCLITINALPVKKSMKNAFSENHIFTEYNLNI